jgi:benzoyl-CoA-dihydrodiol lyase
MSAPAATSSPTPEDTAAAPSGAAAVSFDAEPSGYRHWRLHVDGSVATLTLDVDEHGGLVPGYELKLNSYDLGVDIELHDAVQRLRFEHPQVRAVVLTSGKDRVFCAGANIRMLAQSSHSWKVNFCKFTNETRNGIEDASAHSGITWIAAVNGTASGGGYELALACDRIVLVDDGASAVSLPEVALLGVLPGTGGLTRLVDKRRVRRDLADVVATRAEGVRGPTAVNWRLVDEVVPRSRFDDRVEELARIATAAAPPRTGPGVPLAPLERTVSASRLVYSHVVAEIDDDAGVATLTVHGPAGPQPSGAGAIRAAGVGWWPLALARELDDAVLRLRTNADGVGIWVLRTEGDAGGVLAAERELMENGGDWFIEEVRLYLARTLRRLDVTSRSLIALVEPGSCFAGPLLEVALAADRTYMLDVAVSTGGQPVELVLGPSSFGALPMGNGLTRLQTRFIGDADHVERCRERTGERLDAAQALELGLVTFAPDDIDWDDEVRLAIEERASYSPDALTGMEASLRFAGPETLETKVFGRLSAWQNWVFTRPNASGPHGALRAYGTGRRPAFDRTRV